MFSNSKGRGASRNSLLKSAQHYWEKAGLGLWMIHSLRHTFGTEAGNAGLGVDAIRAGMGHDDRSSSESNVHTDEVAAAEVRGKIYESLSGILSGFSSKQDKTLNAKTNTIKEIECPKCGHKHLIEIDLNHKSLQ